MRKRTKKRNDSKISIKGGIKMKKVNYTCAPAGFWELVDHVAAIDIDEYYIDNESQNV